jgi:hypothetical protein
MAGASVIAGVSVIAGASVGGGASVGAGAWVGVAAGAQAASTRLTSMIMVRIRKNDAFLILFLLSFFSLLEQVVLTHVFS